MTELLVPFAYNYMLKAILISGLVGAMCAFLSAFLMLKGWSLMGDALAHAIVPGVAVAYLWQLPYATGAFFAGLIAALGMHVVERHSRLREDAVIGIVFTAFLAAGLLIVSMYPTPISVQTILLGNVLAISDMDALQVVVVSVITFGLLLATWKDLMVVFFDESHARSIGLRVGALKIMFFVLLSAATVAALQAVGATLVIAMVITPGATAYLLTDRFHRLLILSVVIGGATGMIGAYVSYFVDGATGGVIVCLQTLVFLAAFYLAPKHGLFASRARARVDRNAGGHEASH